MSGLVRRGLLYFLIYFHLFAIIAWTLPSPPKELKIGILEASAWQKIRYSPSYLLYYNDRFIRRPLIENYLRTIGSQQNWNMFAPNPITHDIWIDAVVTLKDGSEAYYLYPRASAMGLVERFIKERFRKFIETVHLEGNAFLWPALADYVARQVYVDRNNPPVHVSLFRHSRKIAAPGEPENDFITTLFFETPILEERL